jgi:hypothetical protein
MSRPSDQPILPIDDTEPADIDDTVGEEGSDAAGVDTEDDADIDEGAFSDEPEALAVMVEDDLDEAILAQPADPFDRISVRQAEKPFHGELPPERDDADL